jgi:hypothetical protein
MDSEPIPDFRRHIRTKDVRQCFVVLDESQKLGKAPTRLRWFPVSYSHLSRE